MQVPAATQPHPLHDKLPSSDPLFRTTQRLLTTVAGSRLYGTSTEASDVDLKGIYLPTARAILLGTARPLLSFSPTHAAGIRNSAADTDATLNSLARFIQLLGDGQPDAVELAFAPESAWVECGIQGRALMERLNSPQGRAAWVTKAVANRMVAFARHQVGTYESKTRKIVALEAARDWLRGFDGPVKLGAATSWDATELWVSGIAMEEITGGDDARGGWRVDVVGKVLTAAQTVDLNLAVVEKALAQYSQRSVDAKENRGTDWKALSHAVRLAYQGRELMETGFLTLPRPASEADLLRQIKRGDLARDVVDAELHSALARLDEAARRATFRESADREWLEKVVLDFHLAAIKATFSD